MSWKEARLALAHEPGSVTPIFGATLGSVEQAGERLAVCALEAGAGSQTRIHGVGDGAVWITEQMERKEIWADEWTNAVQHPEAPANFSFPLPEGACHQHDL